MPCKNKLLCPWYKLNSMFTSTPMSVSFYESSTMAVSTYCKLKKGETHRMEVSLKLEIAALQKPLNVRSSLSKELLSCKRQLIWLLRLKARLPIWLWLRALIQSSKQGIPIKLWPTDSMTNRKQMTTKTTHSKFYTFSTLYYWMSDNHKL